MRHSIHGIAFLVVKINRIEFIIVLSETDNNLYLMRNLMSHNV